MKYHAAAIAFVCLFAMAAASDRAIASPDCSQQSTLGRPIDLGVSGGNIKDFNKKKTKCFGGTLGALIQNKHSKQFILSNNHVLARENKAKPGELIVQPGLIDTDCTETPADAVAKFSRTIPIKFGNGVNLVDAALATATPGNVSATILNIGGISSSTVKPSVGMTVQKMGRTTCLTTGTIKAVGVIVKVLYDVGVATFNNQIRIGTPGFSSSGDSGSLIVTQESCPRAVGLLFAGAENDSFTLANPINAVLRSLSGAPGALSMVGGCAAAAASQAGQPTESPAEVGVSAEAVEAATAIRNRHKDELMRIPGAVGTGIGVGNRTGQAAIEVYVKKLTPQVESVAPSEVEGMPVKLIESGEIVPY
jgi:hypothetical protein